MKKIMFGSAAALCASLGMSSFTTVESSFVGHHYFLINSTKGNLTKFHNADVGFGQQTPITSGCDQSQLNFRCVVTFSNNQVTLNASNKTILKTSLTIAQTRVSTAVKRVAQ